ncbi:MAG: LytTR family transcriptional regulator DNA-binding domain-containing protein [Clostridiaceae bacterium]|nr:LytTR family transcriptional regulator DNA-binding domain-containing protein [Clostridiaceae bacterium]
MERKDFTHGISPTAAFLIGTAAELPVLWQTSITAAQSWRTFAQELSEDFYQAHRSYLVSLKHIMRISRDSVILDNAVLVPLARGKYDQINRAYMGVHDRLLQNTQGKYYELWQAQAQYYK